MEYMIDSANIEKIKELNDYFPIVGVTTNPSILAKCNIDVVTAIKEIRKIIGNKMLHVQVLSTTYEEILEEAKKLNDLGGENTYIKIPVSQDGIKAMKYLTARGYNVTATAIFTPQQALMAATAGAKYVAPYINRLDNIATNGPEIAYEIQKLLKESNLDCKVLAASFSNLEQIHMTSMKGIGSLTIPIDLFTKIISHPLTDKAIKDFIKDGKKYYNFD